MRYRLQWGYCYGGGSAWWMIGMVIGAVSVPVLPYVVTALEMALALFFVAACFIATPLGAVLAMRRYSTIQLARKNVVKRRGPLYADYAYIM